MEKTIIDDLKNLNSVSIHKKIKTKEPKTKTFNKRIFAPATWVLMAALQACSGGGGSGSGSSVNIVTGYAAKGTISNANVLVCRIKPSGSGLVIEPDASCAVGTTSSTGSYSVTMADGWTGPVMVKIQPTANSQVFDETTGATGPYTTELKAVVPSASTPVHVTPFSDLAATAVQKDARNANLTSSSITSAIYMVQQNLGVDLSVKPILDSSTISTDIATAGQQLGMVVALTKVLQAAPTLQGSCTGTAVNCAILALQNSVASSSSLNASAKNVFGTINSQTVTSVVVPIIDANGGFTKATISNVTDPTQIAQGLARALPNTPVPTAVADQLLTGVNARAAEQSNSVAQLQSATVTGGVITYQPPSTAYLSSLEQAKTLVGEVRNTFNYYQAADGSGLLDRQKDRIQSNINDVFLSNANVIAGRARVINLAYSLYDEFTARSGKYQTGSDSDGTFYYKTIGQIDNINAGLYGGGFSIYAKCRTNSNPVGNTITMIICATVASTSSVSWTNSSYGRVRMVRWYFNPVDASRFNYKTHVFMANVSGFQPYAYTINFGKDPITFGSPAITLNPPTPLSGPFNLGSDGSNTASASCLANTVSNNIISDPTGFGLRSGTCLSYSGSGSITRTNANNGALIALNMTGTLNSSVITSAATIQRGLAYDQVNINMARSALVTANNYRYVLSGSLKTVQPTFNTDGSLATYDGAFSQFELPAATGANATTGSYIDDAEVVNLSTGETTYTPVALNLHFKSTISQPVNQTVNQTVIDGTLTAGNFVHDKSGTCLDPTSITFNGSLIDNSTNGLGSFLNINLTGSMPNYTTQYDCSKPESSENYAETNMTFTGSLLAPSRPPLTLALSGTRSYLAFSNNNPTPTLTETVTVSLSYNLSSNTADKFGFTGTYVKHPKLNEVNTLSLRSQDGIVINWIKGVSTKIYSSQGDELGSWGTNGMIYFKDGSYSSL
jgi:hypothetical protein